MIETDTSPNLSSTPIGGILDLAVAGVSTIRSWLGCENIPQGTVRDGSRAMLPASAARALPHGGMIHVSLLPEDIDAGDTVERGGVRSLRANSALVCVQHSFAIGRHEIENG